jgi:hypothetical protein
MEVPTGGGVFHPSSHQIGNIEQVFYLLMFTGMDRFDPPS